MKAHNNELFELPPLEVETSTFDVVEEDGPDQSSEEIVGDGEAALPPVSVKKKVENTAPTTSPVKNIDMSFNKFVHLDHRWSKFTALKTLNLSYNQLETMSSDCFQDCRALTYLDLSHNRLTDVSMSLTSAIHLSYCDLSYNELSDAPQGLFRSTKLKILKLNHNKLLDLTGKVMGMLYDLERLEVQYNQLKRLPSLLYALKKVSYLDISHNNIQELLDEEFGQWTFLQYCDASYNAIPFIPQSIDQCGKTLETLYLHHNQIKELPSTITKLKKLKVFTIHNNALTMTRNVLQLMPWLLHCNLSWNRQRVVKKSFVTERQALNDEERRFTLFGSELDEYYLKKNPHELQPLSYFKKRLYEIQEELEIVVSAIPEREKTFTIDVTLLEGKDEDNFHAKHKRNKSKRSGGNGSNFDILMRWLTKLRNHVVLEEKKDENPHGALRDQLYSIYQVARNNPHESNAPKKKSFHDLLVQVLAVKLKKSSRTQTKVYFSNFQFRQMRPLMYYPFFLDQFKRKTDEVDNDEDEEDEERDQHPVGDEQQYLKEEVIDALFMGFEVIPSIEKLCEFLNDLNILAMIEEINALRRSDKVREHMAKLKTVEESREFLKKRKDSMVNTASSATKATLNAMNTTTSTKAGGGGGRFSLFSSTSKKQDMEPIKEVKKQENDEMLDPEMKEEENKLQALARQLQTDDNTLQQSSLPSEPSMHFYPEGEEPTPIAVMDEITSQQQQDNYFMALMSRIAPYIDVDLFDRKSIHSSSSASIGATMSAIPLMSFPYLTLMRQDQECLNKYDKDFLYATNRQDNPLQDSLLTYFFEVYLSLLKALVVHIEYVQKAMRTLERMANQQFSRLSTLCQRDAYFCLRENKKTKETTLERQEDYEDLLSDMYSAILCDQVAEEKKEADANKTVGMKKKKMIKDFVDQFFAQGELQGLEFRATESLFKKFDNHASEQPTRVEGKEGESETDDGSVGSTKSLSRSQSQSIDGTENEETSPAIHVPIPGHEKLLAALGLPTSEEMEKEKNRISELDDSLLMIDTENPSPKELQHIKKVEATKKSLREKRQARELEAGHRVRVWLDFLGEYRGLLMTWATQCNENAMSILQSRGFDARQPQERSEWLLPGQHISYDFRDPRYFQQQELELNKAASASSAELMKQSLIPQTTLYLSMSPVVIRVIEDEARRLMMYRYRLYQCFPQYQDSMLSYEIFLKYSKGFIPLNAYVGFVRVCLSQGDYTKAHSLLRTTWKKFFGKEIKAYWEKVVEEAAKKGITSKKRIIISDDYSLLEIPKASDLLPINRELAILWKFTEVQLEALNKVKVFSQENHRVFRIREDGLLRKNEDYPAPEIVHGRDLLYQKRIEKLEKEKEMREIVEEKKRAQDELLDGIVSVKSRLERLLQDENVQSLAKTMNLEGLLK